METLAQDEIVKTLGNMTVLDLIALTKRLEKEWGVSASPQAVEVENKGPEIKKEVQTEFTVILSSFTAAGKIPVIKILRDILNIGLKEAKDFAEAAPKTIKENISAEEAESIKNKLTEAGAVIEVK